VDEKSGKSGEMCSGRRR